MRPASSRASTPRRRRQCRIGRRCAASAATPPGASRAASGCTARSSMRRAAAPAPAASTATITVAPGPARCRSRTSRASGARSAVPASRSETCAMPPAHVILEQMDRPIGLILQAPATAAAARIVLSLPFWWSGLSKLLDFSGGTAEMAALRLEPAWLFNALTILVQLGGSLLVILNLRTWLGAGALGVFTALATVMAHRFWTLDGIDRVRELNAFLEHLAIIAGFVLVAILGVVGARGRG